MDYSLPGSSIHGIFQARVLEWECQILSLINSWYVMGIGKILRNTALVFKIYQNVLILSENSWQRNKNLCISNLCGNSPFNHPCCITRKRQWHPTPVLLPRKSHGWRSLVGCSPWGCRVGHDWATSLWLFTFRHWRRKWQPTPVFLPGESQGHRSIVGCRLWGRTESDTTEVT